MLHLLQSKLYLLQIEQLITRMQTGDSLVFMDEGIYNTLVFKQWQQWDCYAMQNHFKSCGVAIPTYFKVIDMPALVTLTIHHQTIVSW